MSFQGKPPTTVDGIVTDLNSSLPFHLGSCRRNPGLPKQEVRERFRFVDLRDDVWTPGLELSSLGRFHSPRAGMRLRGRTKVEEDSSFGEQ